MFNIILTGKILDEIQFKKLINKIIKLKNENKVDQIILSIWKNQILSKEVIFFLKKKDVDIIRNNTKKFSCSFKYQSYLLKNGFSFMISMLLACGSSAITMIIVRIFFLKN